MSETQHGGYRRPSEPAAVSGPGALSQRTDGGPTQPPQVAAGGAYGDRQDMMGIQQGAPMAGGGGGTPAPPPLGGESARPEEPITAGAPVGAGLGPEAAGIASDEAQTLEQLRPMLASLEMMANLPSSNKQTRTFVRRLKAALNG